MRIVLLAIVAVFLTACLGGVWFIASGEFSRTIHAARGDQEDSNGVSTELVGGEDAARDEDNTERVSIAPVMVPVVADVEEELPLDGLLVGRVVDPEGRPLANARVWATTGNNWLKLPLDMEHDGQQNSWYKVLDTTTDASGRFVFESDLRPGSKLKMVLRASGFRARYEDHLNLPEKLPYDIGDMALEPGVILKGRVIDRYGDGVANAAILQTVERGVGGMLVTVPGRGIPLAKTTEDGQFVVDELPEGPWRLIVDAPGCIVREESGRTEAAGEVVDGLLFVVDPGESIHGLLKDAPEDLLTKVRVEARLKKRRRQSEDDEDTAQIDIVHPRVRRAPPGEEAKFVIGGLAPTEQYHLTVWELDEKHGWKRSRSFASEDAFPGARGIELEYKPESRLIFQVVDEKTKEPVTHFQVWAGLRNRARTLLKDDEENAITEHPEGRVTFDELRTGEKGGEVKIRIRAVGYEDYEEDKIFLAEEEEKVLETIELKPTSRVLVTVMDDESGEPVADARVFLTKPGNDNIEWWSQIEDVNQILQNSSVRFATTDAEGKAELAALVGEASEIVVTSENHLQNEPEDLFSQSLEDSTVEIRLKRGGTVIVEVVGPNGKPVKGAGVEHEYEDKEEDDNYNYISPTTGEASDDAGLVHYENLPPGNHAFRVQKQEGGHVWHDEGQVIDAEWQRVRVAEGAEERVTLRTSPRGSLRGIVTEARLPLPGATLALERESEGDEDENTYVYFDGNAGQNAYSALSRHDGRFEFKDVRCGEYILIVSHGERKQRFEMPVTIVPEGSEVEVELPLAILEGVVMDPEGIPIPNLDVRVSAEERDTRTWFDSNDASMYEDENGSLRRNWDYNWRRYNIRTDKNGRYRIRGVHTDRPLTVYVRGSYVVGSSIRDILVSPDEIRDDLDFVLPRAGQIRVKVASNVATGRTWLNLRAELKNDEGKRIQSSNTSIRGGRTRSMSSLRPGTWTLTVRERNAPKGSEPLFETTTEVRINETTRVNIEF